MKRRYKVILNVEVAEPSRPFPAGGDYTHLTYMEGIVRILTNATSYLPSDEVKVSLDKIIDKGEIRG